MPPKYPKVDWQHYAELTREEQGEVVVAAGQGDKSAIEYAWHLFGGIVQKFARHKCQDPEGAIGDLYVGYQRACEKFEPERGFRFSTYLTWWLRGAQHRRLQRSNQFGALRSNENLKVYRRLLQEPVPMSEIGSAAVRAIADELQMSRESIWAVVVHNISPAPLVQTGAFNDYGLEQNERDLPDTDAIPASDLAEFAEVHRFLEQLDPRDAKVVRLRYWDGASLSETGREVGLSTEWVRQIERRALRRLRKLMDQR